MGADYSGDGKLRLHVPLSSGHVIRAETSAGGQGHRLVIGKLVGVAINMVRLDVPIESDRLDRGLPQHLRLADSVHTVHHATIKGQDDRLGQVGFVDEPCVAGNGPAGRCVIAAEPMGFVKFGNLCEGNSLNRQVGAKFNQTIDIPGQQPLIRTSEVVLLSHPASLCPFPVRLNRTACASRPA